MLIWGRESRWLLLQKAKQQLLMLWEEKEEGKEPKLQWKVSGAVSHKRFFSDCYLCITAPWWQLWFLVPSCIRKIWTLQATFIAEESFPITSRKMATELTCPVAQTQHTHVYLHIHTDTRMHRDCMYTHRYSQTLAPDSVLCNSLHHPSANFPRDEL